MDESSKAGQRLTRNSTKSHIHRIGLQRFRSYQQASICCDQRPVCLTGPNGAGKTNLLEAISLLAVGRGLRTAPLTDLIRQNTQSHQGWSVSVRFGDAEQTRSLNMKLLQTNGPERPKRSVNLDGTPIPPANLAELFTLLWLTPAHDRVFAGARNDRRKFFDRLILARSPDHGKNSAEYEKAMRERNSVLLQYPHDSNWLDAIENRMAKSGANIATTRTRAIAQLQNTINNSYQTKFPHPSIFVQGSAETLAGQGENLNTICEHIKSILHRNRKLDANAGRTTCGTHRTDFSITQSHTRMTIENCSTGERKAMLLELMIAAASTWLGEDTQRISLLLLDDAVAHLDSERRNALCERLVHLDAHCWISATDPDSLTGFGNRAQFFSIQQNSVLPLDHPR